jgi:hypothetical protein
LVFDGLTGGIQDKIRDKHKVQAYHMMFSMNIWSCLWASIGVVLTGEIYGLANFIQLYPAVMSKMFLLGLTGAIGQVRECPSCLEILLSALEFHLSDHRMVWPVDLFDLHNDTEVLHHSLFGSHLWQSDHHTADVRHRTRLSRTFPRTISRKEKA